MSVFAKRIRKLASYGPNSRMLVNSAALVITVTTLGIIFSLVIIPSDKPGYVVDGMAGANKSMSVPPAKFGDETLVRGIIAQHSQRGENGLRHIADSLGAGACVFDYDNDGWVDLLIVGGSGQTHFGGDKLWWQNNPGSRLYRNVAGKRFIDVTLESGLIHQGWGMGCLTSDLDNDGDKDVLFSDKGPNHLFRNNANGTFTEVTGNSGISGNSWSTSSISLDMDQDGLLDLLVSNYIKFDTGFKTLEQASGPNQDEQRFFQPGLFSPESNQVYRNLGGLKFAPVVGTTLSGGNAARSLSAQLANLNGDELPDLLLVNDAGAPNRAMTNLGGFEFSESAQFRSFFDNSDTRSVKSVEEGLHKASSYYVAKGPGLQPAFYAMDVVNKNNPDTSLDSSPAVSFKKLVPESRNSYSDLSLQQGLHSPRSRSSSGFGVTTADFNLDGFEDVYQANGLLLANTYSHHFSQSQPDSLWLNQPDAGFSECVDCDNSGTAGSSRAVVSVDFDNDGDKDLFVTRNNDLGNLLINRGQPKSWLGIELDDNEIARKQAGVRAIINGDGWQKSASWVSGDGFLSTSDNRLLFYLPKSAGKSIQLQITQQDQLLFSGKITELNHYYRVSLETRSIRLSQASILSEQQPRPFAGFTESRYNLQLANWLLTLGRDEEALLLLEDQCQSDLSAERIQCVKLLSNVTHVGAIRILVGLLHDVNPQVRMMAIESLGKQEAEVAARAVIEGLSDSSALVQCKAAQSISEWFIKEEAMVRSKYLAIPHLQRNLEEAQEPGLQSCFIKALGYSEHHRAESSLRKYVDSSHAVVQLDAIAALGKLREQKSVTLLLEVFRDRQQPVISRAMALVSLKRLEFGNNLLRALLDELQLIQGSTENTLQILEWLMTNPESVFDPGWVGEWILDRWSLLLNQQASTDTIVGLLWLLSRSGLEVPEVEGRVNIHDYIEHINPSIRAHVFRLILKNDSNNDKWLRRALGDSNNQVQFVAAAHFLGPFSSKIQLDQEADNIGRPVVEVVQQLLNQVVHPESILRLLNWLKSESNSLDKKRWQSLGLVLLERISSNDFSARQCVQLYKSIKISLQSEAAQKLGFCRGRALSSSDRVELLSYISQSENATLENIARDYLINNRSSVWVRRYLFSNYNVVPAVTISAFIESLADDKLPAYRFLLSRASSSSNDNLSELAAARLFDLLRKSDPEQLKIRFLERRELNREKFLMAQALFVDYPELVVDFLMTN
ncbi:MAG: hypothetical protein ACI8P9_004247 [Parasphingorhabdus sp.]|jgi:hypothetical protein